MKLWWENRYLVGGVYWVGFFCWRDEHILDYWGDFPSERWDKGAFKSYFLFATTKKQNKKNQTGIARNFLQHPIQMYNTRTSTPYFKINTHLFCCPLFFKEYPNPKFMINKVVI